MGFGKEYVVGWGTLALINAGLAQGKGRGGLDWFLISLVLGPVATLALVVMDKVDSPAATRAPLAPWAKVVTGVLFLAAIALASLAS